MGHYADMMLGKDKMAEICAIARRHKLAAGSQTVPKILSRRSPPHKANLRQLIHSQPPLFRPPNARNYPSRRPRGRPLG